jgi:hypothetical protein
MGVHSLDILAWGQASSIRAPGFFMKVYRVLSLVSFEFGEFI